MGRNEREGGGNFKESLGITEVEREDSTLDMP